MSARAGAPLRAGAPDRVGPSARAGSPALGAAATRTAPPAAAGAPALGPAPVRPPAPRGGGVPRVLPARDYAARRFPYRGAPVWLGERTRPDREAGPAPAGPGLPRRPGLPPGPGAPRREAALPGPGAVEREPALADVSEFEEALAALPLAREIRLDRRNRVVWVRGAARQLTAKEFALLDHLAKAQSRAGAVSRAELVKAVWAGSPVGQATRTVDIHVGRVRQKLGIAELIVTARGRGYFMNPRWRVRA